MNERSAAMKSWYKKFKHQHEFIASTIPILIPILMSIYAVILAYNANNIAAVSNDIAKESKNISNLTYINTFNSG